MSDIFIISPDAKFYTPEGKPLIETSDEKLELVSVDGDKVTYRFSGNMKCNLLYATGVQVLRGVDEE